jgi:hypothetical protein
MELQHNTQPSRELSSQLVSIMTTEHYNLQSGRAMTVSEANGRASLFVGAVSSGLIALVLVAQLSHLGTAFFVFSLVVLPTLFFMGLITFGRVMQSSLADVTYARGINRIRHLYLEYAPVAAGVDASHLGAELLGDGEHGCYHHERAGRQLFWHAVHPVRVPLVDTYHCGRKWISDERCAAPDLSTRAMGTPGKSLPVNFPRQPIS